MYLQRTYHAPARLEEEVVVAVADQGGLGSEVRAVGEGRVEIVAWYPEVPPSVPTLPAVPGEGHGEVALVSEAWIREEDWLAEYRSHAQPRAVGRRFLVDPREPGEESVAPEVLGDRILLALPAREAFGTGSHASTRLVLSWLEELPVEGSRVLDVGCGSGILSLAARALGAGRTVGFDVDRVSAFLAGENARRNASAVPPGSESGGPTLFAGSLDALSTEARFDLVLVNVLPHRVEREVPAIAARSAPGGRVVVSGLLSGEAGWVLERWTARGLSLRERREEEEWAALLLGAPV